MEELEYVSVWEDLVKDKCVCMHVFLFRAKQKCVLYGNERETWESHCAESAAV